MASLPTHSSILGLFTGGSCAPGTGKQIPSETTEALRFCPAGSGASAHGLRGPSESLPVQTWLPPATGSSLPAWPLCQASCTSRRKAWRNSHPPAVSGAPRPRRCSDSLGGSRALRKATSSQLRFDTVKGERLKSAEGEGPWGRARETRHSVRCLQGGRADC